MNEAQPTTSLPATVAGSTVSFTATASDAPTGNLSGPIPTIPGYEILSELGRGGMAVVYLARQTALKRLVALKTIRQNLEGATARDRFQAEAEAVARLQHPNIVQVFEVGECATGPFVVLEYVQGGSLDQRLKQAALEVRDAALFTVQLARAVQAAHAKGIIHRDLKPGNVLVADAGGTLVPKVSDFGLAKFLDEVGPELTREGAILGTPSYMAPEQASGRAREVGPACDIYALGAILYECLTGRPPFKGATARETIGLVCNNDPVPVRQLRPAVPRDLETICLTCLRKEEGKRYASAADLAADLERFLSGQPIAARPVGRVEKALKWVRRNPAGAALIAVLLLTAIGGAITGVLVYEQLKFDRTLAREGERKATEKEGDANKALADLTIETRKTKEETDRKNAALTYALLQRKTSLATRDIGDAYRALRDFRGEDAARFLNAVEEDVRGWEWRYLNGYLRRSPQVVPGAGTCVAFHPNGTAFVAGARNGEVRVFDFHDLDHPAVWSWHDHEVRRLAFDPTGKYLAAWSSRGLLIVADAATGEELFRKQGQPTSTADAHGLAFTPDGKLLAFAGGDGVVRFVELPGGMERASVTAHTGDILALSFLKNGRWLATASGTEMKVWDAETGKPTVNLEGGGLTGFLFSGAADPVRGRIAGASMGELGVWDATTGKTLWRNRIGTTNWILRMAFSPDGTRLYGKTFRGESLVWDAGSGRDLQTLQVAGTTFTADLAVSPDGKRIAVPGSDGVKLWHLALPLETYALTEQGDRIIKEVAFTPEGREFCYRLGDGRFVRRDLATGKETFRRASEGRDLFPWVLAPGGREYAGVGKDGVVRFFAAETGMERAALTEPIGPLPCLSFSPDGKLLAGGIDAGGVVVIDAATAVIRQRFSTGKRGPSAVAIDASGRYLAAGLWERGLVVWDLTEKRLAWEARVGDGRFSTPVFRPGGKHLAFACADSVIRVYSVAEQQVVFELKGHTNSVGTAAYSPDGKRLATVGDTTLRLWDADTGQLMLTLPVGVHNISDLAFSPDSRRLLVTEAMTVRVYDAPP